MRRHIICFAYPATKIRIFSDIFTIFASWTNKTFEVIKKALKIFWLAFVAVASVIIAVALALQTPAVQTRLAQKAVEMLDDRFEGKVTFERLHFKPFTTMVLKNVVISDSNPVQDPLDSLKARTDTLFKAKYVIVNLSLKGLKGNEGIHLDKVSVQDAFMNLVLEDAPYLEHKDKGNNLSRIFGLDTRKKEKKTDDRELFHIRKVSIEDMAFRLINSSSEKTRYEGGINWNDMDVNNIDLTAKELQFKGGIMSGEVTSLSFREKSGYVCHSLTGSSRVGRGRAIIEDIRLTDTWSDIFLPLYMMSFSNVKDFSNYIEKIQMDAEIGESIIDFRTLGFFAPQLAGNRLRIDVDHGLFSGTVDDFSITDMTVASEAGGFEGTLSGRMTGIPEIENTLLDAHVRDFSITSEGLGRFVSEWMKGKELDLSRFASGEEFHVNANAEGLLNDLDIDADIDSKIGGMLAELNLKNILSEDKGIEISGSVHTKDLNIGKVIGKEIVGQTTMFAEIDGSLGDKNTSPNAIIDSISIERLHLHGYDYSNISGEGSVSAEAFNGRITCNDPNLQFIFQGRFGISRKTQNALYRFYAIVGHADLNALNLDLRGKSEMRFNTQADFRRTPNGDIYGEINVDDLVLRNGKGEYEIGDINLTSSSRNNTYRMKLSSEFAEGSFSGTAPVTEFITDLGNITLKRELPSLFSDASYNWNGNRYNVDISFGNANNLLNFVMPGMFLDHDTRLSAKINDRGRFNSTLTSRRIAFNKQYLKDVEFNVNNNDDSFNGRLSGSELKAATLHLYNNDLTLLAKDDNIGLSYIFDNETEPESKGELIVRGNLSRQDDDLRADVSLLPSRIIYASNEWKIQPSSLSVSKNGIDVKSVEFLNDDQRISLTGKASKTHRDTLDLSLNRFDISLINSLLAQDFGISGDATGLIQITSPIHSKGILIDMICDSTEIAGKPLGELAIGSRWNEDFELFDITVKNSINGSSSIDAKGRLTPKTRSLEADAYLNRLYVGYAQPFLADVFSEMDGYISGNISVDGPLNALAITSNGTRLDEAMLRIDYTNVPYYADGAFHIDETGVYFDEISIRDRFNGTGSVSGSINWDNFRDISFDTRIKVNEIEGINLTEKQSETFYGNIFGTGNITISGPVSSIVLNVDAVTAKNGELHIPISASATSDNSNLLTFTEVKKEVFIDPYDIMISSMDNSSKSDNDFLVNLHVNASPDVTAYVEIDKASGHVLSGRGNGRIELQASDDIFNINGDYTLTGGNYKFVALGFVNRDFEIQDGSSVTFNGDIMESTLDIDAIYKTKASLSTLIADTTSVANRRTVECGIKITDKISNPRLAFSIEIPELDPTIKSRVESALSTEDKRQKQFLSILLSNSFLPDDQSGIFNNSTMLYSNVSEVMASQFNNILQKLDIPVDLGLNYQPNEKGNDVFDVAVSTQMFNNRVIVNGSVGNKQYTSGNAQTDVVGDLDIEIKLDRSGSFRLNLFSHSADSYTNYLDNSQRNGVGLTYQAEFNSLKQFFKNMFSSKKKRQEAKRLEEEAMIDGKKINLDITENDTEDGNGRK